MAWQGKKVGLALSGGGYRATLFNLGGLWRLNEMGWLQNIDRITSVSGGSILSGVLATRWHKLQFQNGVASNFKEEVVEPVQKFCSEGIDIAAGIKGILTPFKSKSDYLVATYRDKLFGNTTLQDLPDDDVAASPAPRFVFYATNYQTGVSFRFSKPYLADYFLGLLDAPKVQIATAVAASSGFPPIFSPLILKTDPSAWRDGSDELQDIRKYRKKIPLVDGGVYDNMGLQGIWESHDIVLACDAGAPFKFRQKQSGRIIAQLGRVRDIGLEQAGARRRDTLVDRYKLNLLEGTYWGIATKIVDYNLPDVLTGDTAKSRALQTVRTRLNAFKPEEQGQLINWGYALADAAMRTYVDLTPIGLSIRMRVLRATLEQRRTTNAPRKTAHARANRIDPAAAGRRPEGR